MPVSFEEWDRILPPLPEPERRPGAGPREAGRVPSIREVRELLASIPPTLPYHDYLRAWMAVAWCYPGQEGLDLVDEWSSEAREANGQFSSPRTQPQKHWAFRRHDGEAAITAGTLYHLAAAHGWRPPPRPAAGLVRPGRTASGGAAAAKGAWEPPLPFHHNDLPPFPTHALPEWARDFVAAVARATQTPADLSGLLVLTAGAAACGGKVKVQVRAGWTEPVNLYTVTALPPGNRKSAVFRDIAAPIRAYERAEIERMAPEIKVAESRHKIKAGALKRAEEASKATTATDRAAAELQAAELVREVAKLRIPASPRLVTDDVTPEKLVSLLHEQGGRMAVLSAEGGPFEMMAGRYAKNGAPQFEVYLKGHAGDMMLVDRLGRASECVDDPALTVGLTVQPEVLRTLAERPAFHGRGLLARFLYAVPHSLVGGRDVQPPPVPAPVRDAYATNLHRLLALPAAGAPPALRCDDGAEGCFLAFQREIEPQLGEFAALGDMVEWGSKLVGAVARIAGVLHLMARCGDPQPWASPITAETVEAAICIGRYLIPHARAAFALMGADAAVEDARCTLRWLVREARGAYQKQEIWQGTRGRFAGVERLDRALALLVEHRYIREQPPQSAPAPVDPRRRSTS